jgi:hypothetical protein
MDKSESNCLMSEYKRSAKQLYKNQSTSHNKVDQYKKRK